MAPQKVSQNRCRKILGNRCQHISKKTNVGSLRPRKKQGGNDANINAEKEMKCYEKWKRKWSIVLIIFESMFWENTFLRKRCMYANHMNPAVEYVPARVRPRRRTSNKLETNQKNVWKKKPQNSERNSGEKHWKIHEELMHESWKSTKKTMLGKDMQKVLKHMPKYSQNGSQKLPKCDK